MRTKKTCYDKKRQSVYKPACSDMFPRKTSIRFLNLFYHKIVVSNIKQTVFVLGMKLIGIYIHKIKKQVLYFISVT